MNTTSLFPRWIKPRIAEAMADTPVVLLAGPRQAGKTTLVRQVAEHGLRYLTLDDELTLLSAREDPVGMIRSLDRAVIDEIQRAPALLLAIKKSVDEDRRPGRFLLTGSANLMWRKTGRGLAMFWKHSCSENCSSTRPRPRATTAYCIIVMPTRSKWMW